MLFLSAHFIIAGKEKASFSCWPEEIKMYAVVKTGGKQYKVTKGEVIKVEKLDAEVGSEVDLQDVLMVIDGDSIRVGSPILENATVKAKVLEHGKDKKVIVFKKKRRKGYKKKRGHRQHFTTLEIRDVSI